MNTQFGKWKVVQPEGKKISNSKTVVKFVQNTETDSNNLFVLKTHRPVQLVTRSNRDGSTEEVVEDYSEEFKDEIKIAAEMDHPNVIKVVDYDLENDPAYMVMEYCSGGTLKEADLKKWTISEKMICYDNICDAFGYLWEKGYSKQDHNFKNIFLKEDGRTPVIGDFEYCNKIGKSTELFKQIMKDMGRTFWELMEGREFSVLIVKEMRINKLINELMEQESKLQKQIEELQQQRAELLGT